MKRTSALPLTLGLFLCVLFFGWRTHGQGRQRLPPEPSRVCEYNFDTASKSFPTEADKTKINLYAANGWELVAVSWEGNQTVLVFKRLKESGQ